MSIVRLARSNEHRGFASAPLDAGEVLFMSPNAAGNESFREAAATSGYEVTATSSLTKAADIVHGNKSIVAIVVDALSDGPENTRRKLRDFVSLCERPLPIVCVVASTPSTYILSPAEWPIVEIALQQDDPRAFGLALRLGVKKCNEINAVVELRRRMRQNTELLDRQVNDLLDSIYGLRGAGSEDRGHASYVEKGSLGQAGQWTRATMKNPEAIRRLITMHKKRQLQLGPGTVDDAVWIIMFDMLLAELNDKKISVTSLCVDSGASTTTAFRRLRELIDSGYAAKMNDPDDKRRLYVCLTDKGRNLIASYLEDLHSAVIAAAEIA